SCGCVGARKRCRDREWAAGVCVSARLLRGLPLRPRRHQARAHDPAAASNCAVGSAAGDDAVSAREPRPTTLIDVASANMERMLGYVFWHWPSPAGDRRAYEEELAAFHKTLGDEPPGGFVRSVAFRLSRLPFAGAG